MFSTQKQRTAVIQSRGDEGMNAFLGERKDFTWQFYITDKKLETWVMWCASDHELFCSFILFPHSGTNKLGLFVRKVTALLDVAVNLQSSVLDLVKCYEAGFLNPRNHFFILSHL